MSSTFNSQALIIARESRGRSQAEVANAAKLTQGAISKAETDVLPLSADQIERVAVFLDYPPSFFSEPGQLRDGASICHYHRKRKTLPAKVLNRVNATMFVRNVNIRHMMNGLEFTPSRQFHALDIEEFGSPTAVAQALRRSWRVAEGPIPSMVTLIESAAGIVVLAPFGHRRLFGMSCWPTQDQPLFYLNSEIPMADLRWTMAHELGHLTMHGTPSANDIEKEANEFAAEFLTPAGSVAPDLRGLRWESLGPLKLHWRVSMKTLIHRAESLGCISREQAQRLYKRHSAHLFNTSEPYEIPAETPSLMASAAKVHLEDHDYTPEQLRAAIRLSTDADYQEVTRLSATKGRLSVVG